MKYIFTLLFAILFIACNNPDKTSEESSFLAPQVNTNLSPLQKTIDSALKKIVKTDFTSSGDNVQSIEIDGMEIIKFSEKDYYSNELKDQENAFKNYIEYLKRFPKDSNPLISAQQLETSKAKHDAVISYLKNTIKTASTNPELYKVVYFLKLKTNKNEVSQPQTTFLDKSFNKKIMDYSFLK